MYYKAAAPAPGYSSIALVGHCSVNGLGVRQFLAAATVLKVSNGCLYPAQPHHRLLNLKPLKIG